MFLSRHCDRVLFGSHRLRIAYLIWVMVAALGMWMPSRVSAAPVAEGQRLILACAADNDLFRVLTENRVDCVRFDTPAQAVAMAPQGAGLLILADGYPTVRTAVDAAIFNAAAAKKLRLYIEFPSQVPGVSLGETAYERAGHYGALIERTVVMSDFFGQALSKHRILKVSDCHYVNVERPAGEVNTHLVLSQVEGYDTAVYGVTEAAHPLLFELADRDILVSTTKLSHFVTGRYAPVEVWTPIWKAIIHWASPNLELPELAWTPTVRPMYGTDEELPQDALDLAVKRGADYYHKSRLFLHPDWPAQEGQTGIDPSWPVGDGSHGIAECYISKRIFLDGSQAVSRTVRADCNLEAAMGLAVGAALLGNEKQRETAIVLNDLVFFDSIICQGPRADPASPSFGLIGGNTEPAGSGLYWGDDNARGLLSAIASAALLESDEWDAPIVRAVLANFRTSGIYGFRPQNIQEAQLQQNGWKHYFNLEHVDHCAHMQSYIWAMYFWLYDKTGYEPLLERGRKGLGSMMKAHPNWRLEANRYEQERCRMLLPLAWLVRVDDTPEHRRWLDEMARYVMDLQDESGAIPQVPGHVVQANTGYGTHECAIVHEAGDPATDALYTINFAFLGMHEAAAATGNADYAKSAQRMADFFIRTQTQSQTRPELDGTWYRGFDFRKWDYWASDGDWGWGVWTNEIGWTHSWITATLGFQKLRTSLWDLSADSNVNDHFEKYREMMLEE